MNKLLRFFMVIVAVVVFSIFALSVQADVTEPGSESDPLVTKSYVDKVLSNLKQYVDSKPGSSSGWEIVYMEQGQSLIGDKGTEIILRSGIATVVDEGNGGLADITEGKDIINGENVMQNHLLIVPRDDGRGVKAENNNVILLIKGSYTIIK
ncbi:conserved exported protein of unknown function [Tepidanaerobacter acetatoxydans Re1]|uniref:Uncharacterized protein n=1 Tax=Tepidanaerobacter acetatoxydans (strain DSM 21804 / JCM 16047 / Re1) TaxID=1209989 RepID=F4LWU2_TEPAE|nr:hypothetical protein [Tepidanaerobacter acetatoxydans]AEE91814.1 hypothetical protein TepRe1_1678 [Tepidanaerobacter acetatoxydans Re1]CCP26607.1 conserved exported protein of unknown function [Tepidanaerobacter acetatoxydans Re1]